MDFLLAAANLYAASLGREGSSKLAISSDSVESLRASWSRGCDRMPGRTFGLWEEVEFSRIFGSQDFSFGYHVAAKCRSPTSCIGCTCRVVRAFWPQELVPTHLRLANLQGVPENRDRTAVAKMAAAVKAGEGSGQLELALRHEGSRYQNSIRILRDLLGFGVLPPQKQHTALRFVFSSLRLLPCCQRRTHQPLTRSAALGF